jgi:hypothetical protein
MKRDTDFQVKWQTHLYGNPMNNMSLSYRIIWNQNIVSIVYFRVESVLISYESLSWSKIPYFAF